MSNLNSNDCPIKRKPEKENCGNFTNPEPFDFAIAGCRDYSTYSYQQKKTEGDCPGPVASPGLRFARLNPEARRGFQTKNTHCNTMTQSRNAQLPPKPTQEIPTQPRIVQLPPKPTQEIPRATRDKTQNAKSNKLSSSSARPSVGEPSQPKSQPKSHKATRSQSIKSQSLQSESSKKPCDVIANIAKNLHALAEELGSEGSVGCDAEDTVVNDVLLLEDEEELPQRKESIEKSSGPEPQEKAEAPEPPCDEGGCKCETECECLWKCHACTRGCGSTAEHLQKCLYCTDGCCTISEHIARCLGCLQGCQTVSEHLQRCVWCTIGCTDYRDHINICLGCQANCTTMKEHLARCQGCKKCCRDMREHLAKCMHIADFAKKPPRCSMPDWGSKMTLASSENKSMQQKPVCCNASTVCPRQVECCRPQPVVYQQPCCSRQPEVSGRNGKEAEVKNPGAGESKQEGAKTTTSQFPRTSVMSDDTEVKVNVDKCPETGRLSLKIGIPNELLNSN